MNNLVKSSEDLELELGEQFRQLRIQAGWNQKELASKANISLGALMNLENGKGSTLKTMIKVSRALARQDWLEQLSPQITISPIALLKSQKAKKPRRNVYSPRKQKD